MEFGVFDHLDNDHQSFQRYYEERLKLIEIYDRAGFHAYHLAEHHATTLGMAPSPNVFLSAIAQRTKQLRFGPMVYALPLYHPLRLAEEIAMLDQLSGGRFELGVGRGISPLESRGYGENPDYAVSQKVFTESLDIIRAALAGGKFVCLREGRYVAVVMGGVWRPSAPRPRARGRGGARA